MIRSLTGTLRDVQLGTVVLDVHGVGYHIHIQSGRGESLLLDSTLSLHTHLAVREDSLTLYGFFDRDDLALFEMLIELPKIGPKSALQILSQAPVELIKKSVASNDAEHLHKMSGMGRKTAEKIVQGLKDVFGDALAVSHHERGDSDVIDALVTLGYSQREARESVARLSPETTDTNARVKEALRLLSK